MIGEIIDGIPFFIQLFFLCIFIILLFIAAIKISARWDEAKFCTASGISVIVKRNGDIEFPSSFSNKSKNTNSVLKYPSALYNQDRDKDLISAITIEVVKQSPDIKFLLDEISSKRLAKIPQHQADVLIKSYNLTVNNLYPLSQGGSINSGGVSVGSVPLETELSNQRSIKR